MIGFLDCYSGVSGDMLLGALVDAGVQLRHLDDVLSALRLDGEVHLWSEQVQRAGIRATRVHVELLGTPRRRGFEDAIRIVQRSSLPQRVRDTGVAVLSRIAEAEAAVHRHSAEAETQLKEVADIDTLVDVMGTVTGLALLGIDQLFASSLPVAPSEVTEGESGALPGPAPATMAMLAESHAPLRPFGTGYELVTPTGAALVATLANFGQPDLCLERVGYGAGAVETPWPNVLRLWLGSGVSQRSPLLTEGRIVMETNIDDMNPQILASVTELLFKSGALDVHSTPLLMKKGRLGVLLTVIANASDETQLAHILLGETTTLGLRVHDVRRYEAERRLVEVDTAYGRVLIKLKLLHGRIVAATPEFDSVCEAATLAGGSISDVHAHASAAAVTLVPQQYPSDRESDN